MSKTNRRFTPPPPPADPLEIAQAASNDGPSCEDVGAEHAVLTVNGKPIPPEFAHVISYRMTDQGIAEAAANRTHEPSGVEVTGDAWDKALQRRAEAETWDSFDPLVDAVAQVREPGFAYRAISPRVADKRGLRGWEKVLGKDGREQKVGNLFIGRMPIELQKRRNAHYARLGNEQLADSAQQYQLDQEKLVKDANVSGLAPLRVGDHVHDRTNPDFSATIGVETQRGTGTGA